MPVDFFFFTRSLVAFVIRGGWQLSNRTAKHHLALCVLRVTRDDSEERILNAKSGSPSQFFYTY